MDALLPSPIIATEFDKNAQVILSSQDCLSFLRSCPSNCMQLIITSPPYNIGKEYETKLDVSRYVDQQKAVIEECVRVLKPEGSICWQIGNYVDRGSIIPLDSLLYPIFANLGLKMRNRVIWHFEHGLHCSKRLSGRYETVVWYTKSDQYTFNLDPIRIPQKYPGKKHFKGPRAGEYSCNPLGKNPGDVWIIPNVKNNHVEKTDHPCQFPVELVERFVLSLTKEGDWVYDPFLGSGTTVIAAVMHDRKGAGTDIVANYIDIARERVVQHFEGSLRTRKMGKPVYDPARSGSKLLTAPWAGQLPMETSIEDRL